MTKRLIDIDEAALRAAQAELGTGTIKDPVNEALRRVARHRQMAMTDALDALATAELADRGQAWR